MQASCMERGSLEDIQLPIGLQASAVRRFSIPNLEETAKIIHVCCFLGNMVPKKLKKYFRVHLRFGV